MVFMSTLLFSFSVDHNAFYDLKNAPKVFELQMKQLWKRNLIILIVVCGYVYTSRDEDKHSIYKYRRLILETSL